MFQLIGLSQYFSRRLRWLLWLTFFSAPVAAFAEVAALVSAVPFLEALSRGIQPAQDNTIASKALVFSLLLFLATLARLLSLWLGSYVAAYVAHQLAKQVLLRFLSVPYERFLAIKSSQIIAASIQYTSQVGLAFRNLIQLAQSACNCLALFATLVYVNAFVALVLAAGLLLLYLLIYRFNRRLLDRFSKINVAATADQLRVATESIGAIRDIQLSSTQLAATSIFADADLRFRRTVSHIEVLAASPRFILEFILLASIALLSVLMSDSGLGAGSTLPILGVFAFGGQRIIPALQQCYASQAVLRSTLPAIAIVEKALSEPRASEHHQPASAHSSLGRLRTEGCPILVLQNITYRYPEASQPVIANTSLQLHAGECIGIVGSTGSGKSTLLDIIMSLLSPQSGQVLVDGVDISRHANRGYEVEVWREGLAHVPQNVFIADTTLQQNIIFDSRHEQLDLKRMIDAAKSAQIHDYIQSLPQGYQTLVGERGAMLSGGQRQRLGLARAIYKKPSLLLLDEATSALDADTEVAVIDAIHRLRHESKMTVVMVSHKRSTLRSCDRIIELFSSPGLLTEHHPPYSDVFMRS